MTSKLQDPPGMTKEEQKKLTSLRKRHLALIVEEYAKQGEYKSAKSARESAEKDVFDFIDSFTEPNLLNGAGSYDPKPEPKKKPRKRK